MQPNQQFYVPETALNKLLSPRPIMPGCGCLGRETCCNSSITSSSPGRDARPDGENEANQTHYQPNKAEQIAPVSAQPFHALPPFRVPQIDTRIPIARAIAALASSASSAALGESAYTHWMWFA